MGFIKKKKVKYCQGLFYLLAVENLSYLTIKKKIPKN